MPAIHSLLARCRLSSGGASQLTGSAGGLRLLQLAAALSLGTLVAMGAHAAPSTRIQASALAGYGQLAEDTIGPQAGPSSVAGESPSQWGHASYAASADYGRLGMELHASTRGTDNYFGYEGWNSVATASLRSEDSLTFTAPAGVEWIEFRLSLTLHGSLSGDGRSSGLLESELWGSGYLPLPGPTYSAGVRTGLYYNYVAPGREDWTTTDSAVYRVAAGGAITLYQTMYGAARSEPFPAQAGILPPSSMALEAGHTAYAGITLLTPGASFVAESGALYAPVPEPSALALMGVGALGLLAAVRRRGSLQAAGDDARRRTCR